jgi:hypothetical protein
MVSSTGLPKWRAPASRDTNTASPGAGAPTERASPSEVARSLDHSSNSTHASFPSFPSSSLGTPCPGSSSFPPATAETRRLSREPARISFPRSQAPAWERPAREAPASLLLQLKRALFLGSSPGSRSGLTPRSQAPAWERAHRSWSFCTVVFPSWSLGTRSASFMAVPEVSRRAQGAVRRLPRRAHKQKRPRAEPAASTPSPFWRGLKAGQPSALRPINKIHKKSTGTAHGFPSIPLTRKIC